MNKPNSSDDFQNGLVFGFDVGTGSIGYAVRKGRDFKDVGVLICDSEGSDLSKRRELRRQRRTLRSKKYRRQWFAKELINLGLPKPEQPPHDPVSLRLRALNGEALKPEELHAALTHLFKRRGYSKVPWANVEKAAKENAKPKKDDEEGEIKKAVESIRKEMDEKKCKFPCQLLDTRRKEAGESPVKEWARKIYWPRDLLEKEFRAVAEAQGKNFLQLAEKTNWLLYGDSQPKGNNGEVFHVFFKTTEARNPGVLGLRWPRFDNRGPALDSLQPVDEQGRPLHVVRKNKEAFTKAQWELALMNFRVIDRTTGKLVVPNDKSLTRLREIWENGKRKKKTANEVGELETIKISEPVLKRWAKDFAAQYKLLDGQQPLTPQTGAGRARYSSPTLEKIMAGERFDPPQPLLRRRNESPEQALNRYLADVKHPLVHHRLLLFQRLLKKLVSRFGEPDTVVLEAVRSLALGKDKKREYIQRIHNNREERESIRKELSRDGFSSSQNSVLRYRLFKEAKGRCPFCLCPFCLQQIVLRDAEIEHLIPCSRVNCNEFYNLSVAHQECNKKKDNRTPWEAFGRTEEWEALRKNAEDCFGLGSLKYQLFTNPDAQNLIEEKSDLQHTAYIARVFRQATLIQLGWLGDNGRDPTGLKDPQKTAWRFQVTNGQLTSRLRKAWGLNQILHPLPPGKRWDELTQAEQNQFSEKNRGDLRHHALDAMVIACTLPWLAHRTHGATDEFGRHGWWTQDEKHRSKAANPIFPKEGQMRDLVKEEIGKVVVRYHVAKGNKRKFFDTTRYGKRSENLYVARKVLAKMNPKQLAKIYPESQSVYLLEAWNRFVSENPDVDTLLKEENRGKDQSQKVTLPGKFISKLCFSEYQQWMASQKTSAPLDFRWPKHVRIPFKSVRVIADDGDGAMFETKLGSKTFVSQTEFKEVRMFLPPDGKKFVAQFVRPWVRKNQVEKSTIPEGSKLICTFRRGDILVMKKADTERKIETQSRWILKKTFSSGRVSILPSHLSNDRDVLISLGFDPINFLRISMNDLMRVLGHELPHPPSVKPQPQSPHQA